MEIIISLLLIIIIALLAAIYRKLYWIKIDVGKTDGEKEARLKQEISESERSSSALNEVLKEANGIEDVKRREEIKRKLWRRFLAIKK